MRSKLDYVEAVLLQQYVEVVVLVVVVVVVVVVNIVVVVDGECTVIFVSNLTTVDVLLRLSWGFDNCSVVQTKEGRCCIGW